MVLHSNVAKIEETIRVFNVTINIFVPSEITAVPRISGRENLVL